MNYSEQLQIQELNKNIINNILVKYTKDEINEYYFNHTRKETVEYFGLRTIKQLIKLLKLTGYDFSQTKPTLMNWTKVENRRSHESYVNGGKKSAETQRQHWQEKTDEEKTEWSNKMKESHSSEETRQLLRKVNKEHWANMTEEEKRKHAEIRSIANKNKWAVKEELELRNKKINETKSKNHSFNISTPEERYYSYLCNIYGESDIIRQYSDERYPFACDFYIKSKDMFIELNLTWTHGGKLFDKDNQADINKLALWEEKAKTSRYYKQAVYTWTNLDVRKMNIALENKLNYKVYYSEEEMYNTNIEV